MKYFNELNESDKMIASAILENSLNEAGTVSSNSSFHPELIEPLIFFTQENIASKDLVDTQPVSFKEGRVYGLDVEDGAGNVLSGLKVGAAFDEAFSATAENADIPNIVLKLRESIVVAKSRKALLNYTKELAQDLKILKFNLDKERAAAVGVAIASGIDYDVLKAIKEHSDFHTAIEYPWSYDKATQTFLSKLYELKTAIMAASGNIATATKKGLANYVIVPTTLAQVVVSMPGFVAGPEPKFGVLSKIGKLDYLDVYVNTFDSTTYDMYVGKKCQGNISSGIIYSPYQVMTGLLETDADNFSSKLAIFNRYGITKVTDGNSMYHKVSVTGLTNFPY